MVVQAPSLGLLGLPGESPEQPGLMAELGLPGVRGWTGGLPRALPASATAVLGLKAGGLSGFKGIWQVRFPVVFTSAYLW